MKREDIKKQLLKVEKELDKNRTSVLQDGWQTMRHAKKSRKWDMLAIEKNKLLDALDDLGESVVGRCEQTGEIILESDDYFTDNEGLLFLRKNDWRK